MIQNGKEGAVQPDRLVAIKKELEALQVVSNGGIVNGVQLGMKGITQPWLQGEISRCKRLLKKYSESE